MMPLDRTIDMTGHVNTAGVFPPNPQGQLLHTPAALTSSLTPEIGPSYVLTLRYGRVRLTTSGYLEHPCMQLSTWFYKMAGY